MNKRDGGPAFPQAEMKFKPDAAGASSMSAEHTPGPWRVIIDDDGRPLSGRPGVFASEELDCAIVHWDGFVQEYWRSARGDREIHANARLIAAAPAMAEALRVIVENYDSGNYKAIDMPAARAALAAAGLASIKKEPTDGE